MLNLSPACLRNLRLAALLALMVVVPGLFVGGAQPVAVGLFPVPWDKVAHLALFALLAVLIGIASGLGGSGFSPTCRAEARPTTSARMSLLLAFFGAVAIGAADEWHQMFLPGRQAGWDDFAFDALGALVGTWALTRLRFLQW